MISKKTLMMLAVIIATLSFPASAQKPLLYIKAIGGTYNMEDMKDFLEMNATRYTNYGVPTRVTSDFPFSVQAEVGIDFEAKKYFAFGPWINYATAKGELTHDNTSTTTQYDFTRLTMGFKVSGNIYKGFDLFGKLGVNASILDVNVSDLTSIALEEDKEYLSNGVTFELGGQWKYSFNRVKLITNFGYEVGFSDNLIDRETGGYELKNAKGEPVKPNWTGIRFAIGIGFTLGKNHKEFTPKTIEID